MKISDLIIDKEFESVIPPLEEKEFEFLEESIVKDGEVYHPINCHTKGFRVQSYEHHLAFNNFFCTVADGVHTAHPF